MRAKWFLLAAVGLLAVSCAKEQSETPSSLMKDFPSITASTTASVATRVSVAETEDLKKVVNWDTGDAISIFYHNAANLQFALKGEGGSPSGVFSYVSGIGLGFLFPQVYGVFPYAEATSLADGVIHTPFPAEQTFTEKSFDPQSNLMVAVSRKPELFFQHVGGFLLLQLYGEDVQVTKAELRGRAGEILAGPAEVIASEDGNPSIWLDPETGIQTLTLVSDEPVAVHESRDNPTEFWLVVPPTLFEEGFTVTVTDAEGGVLVAEVTSAVEIERSTIFRMDPLCLKRVASGFAAEITWTYAEDAETDHDVFYEGEGTYGRTALTLDADAATVAKYGEEIDATEPKEVTVSVINPDGGDALPADDVKVSNIALKDGELVADVVGFAWDVLYQVTIQYELSTCDLTLEGTLATADRSREPIVLETVSEYTFTLGECDEEMGYGYSGDSQGTGDGWYYWAGDDLDGEIFAAFQSAGLVAADYYADLDSFSASELGDNVSPADPASIPEGVGTYVGLSTCGMSLYTTDSFTEAVLTGDLFSSGVPSTSDSLLVQGDTLYLCYTTYLGQEVQIPFVFNYKDADSTQTPTPAILFSEDFEDNFADERLKDWIRIDADKDGYNWFFLDDSESFSGVPFQHHSGTGHITSESYNNSGGALTPDNWLITPAFTLSKVSNYLSFWVAAQDPSYPDDYFGVYITTDIDPSSDPDDYTCLLTGMFSELEPFEASQDSLVLRVVLDIPEAFKGKTVHIAFRHFNCYDIFRLNLDDIYVTEARPVAGDRDPEPEPEPELEKTFIYRTTFDDEGQIAGWGTYDYDGDGYGWGIEDYYVHGNSGYCLKSDSYYGGALDPDNWLLSPKIVLGSETNHLRFWAMSYYNAWADHYGVYVMEYTLDLNEILSALSGTPLFEETASEEWHQVDVVIPDEFQGKSILILFRHYNSYDKMHLFLDDVDVYSVAASSPKLAPARRSFAAWKKDTPKRATPGLKKEDTPVSKYAPLPARLR
ncbi:MAG: choice-of-anchor J domain-containing protein [Bacteroidales bacterium]|nr:choice-of-anchor J domain-containing protein [Bacteroidales bacterium]